MSESNGSVESFKKNRQAYHPSPQCPACGAYHTTLQYSEAITIPGMDGSLVEVSRFDSEPDPHLVVACSGCSFSWTMKVWRQC